jgi:hypothetical protein
MSADKLKRLAAFHKRLRDKNEVVKFDPDLPPIAGVSNKGLRLSAPVAGGR